jgi:hypothetical protein
MRTLLLIATLAAFATIACESPPPATRLGSVAPTNPETPIGPITPAPVKLPLIEDFSTYASTADFLANPRGIWLPVEAKNTNHIVIDRTVGYGNSTQSMRYDWPNNGAQCLDYSIKPGMLRIPGNLTHVWIEFVVRFSTNFSVNAGASGCASEYKLASLGDYSNGVGRWDVPEMQAGQFNLGAPWTNADLTVDKQDSPSTLWDGQPHVFRIEAELGSGTSTGVLKFWVDGQLRVNKRGFLTTSSHHVIDIFSPGLNLNQGPAIDGMQMWWHRIAIYGDDPGW